MRLLCAGYVNKRRKVIVMVYPIRLNKALWEQVAVCMN